jgi:signal transduction histidine kinase/ligand-binding sensor domain-containing protein
MKNLSIMGGTRYLLLVLLQSLCFFGFAQQQNLHFDNITTNEGLSQSNVTCIQQDDRGFMWFGTRDGLNKYDGYRFTVYKHEAHTKNSISNNYITAIKKSTNGYLWIGTWGGGLNKYDHKKNQFTAFKHNPKNSNSISSDIIDALLEDSEGNLWIGSQDAGLDMYDPKKNTFTHYTYNSNNDNSLGDEFVKYIFEDSKRNLWVATGNGGLNLLNRKNKTFTRFQHNPKVSTSISSNDIYTLFEDSKNRLWIGTNGSGMDLFNRETGEFKHFKHDINNGNSLANDVVIVINEDDKNNLWIGTENGGLSIFNPSTRLFQTYQNNEFDAASLSNNSIYSIYKDTKGNFWIGTFNAGVNLVSPDKGRFVHYKHMAFKNSLSHNNVLCIYEDSKKNIWIGTDGGGLNMFDRKTGIFSSYRHKANDKNSICGNYVLSVCEDKQGNLWIGTWGDGITVYNRAKNTFKHFKNNPADASSLSSNNAWKIFKDDENDIWVGTYGGGLNLYNPANNTFRRFMHKANDKAGISGSNVQSINQHSGGKLLISLEAKGLNLFDKKTETFTHFFHNDNKNSISSNRVCNILEDSNKNLWIATVAGLSFLDAKTNLFKTYTTADGLPNNVIFGILEDEKKNLWISTSKGISRYNPVTKEFKNFGIADGLQGNEFKEHAFCRSSTGAMYFGGNNGFNQFFPDSIKPIAFEPPLVITNFQVFNKEVQIATGNDDPSPLKKDISETHKIKLPYKSSVFSFEFASLNYTSKEKKQYAYMLEGFDKNWIEAGTNRIATYTNLDPNKYTFKVKGLNNEGDWSSNITTLQLTITPPFWLTWWFKLIIFLTVTGGIVGVYYYRMNIIQAQKRVLEDRVKMQTSQLVHLNDEEHRARLEAEKAHADSDKARERADRFNIELERKNKELEQFAYVASHDLQEPLRTSSSYIQLIQKQYKGQLDDKADKYFNYIVDSSDRMKTLIKDLLDFSRIGIKGEFVKVDCNKIMQDVLADLTIAISDCSAKIKFENLPVINGYPTEIKQLFQNLIINAIKFRRKDVSPEVNISAIKINNYWQFAFTDNGIGIDKQHNEKIFIIFQRLHNRTEYKGSGIGLSHCKKIAELHHGKIWVKSVPGEGSTFYFTIRTDN